MSNDVYQAPEAELDTNVQYPTTLASRWQRLAASIIDGIILMIFVLPVFYAAGYFYPAYFQEENFLQQFILNIVAGLASVTVFLLINARLLFSRGKTVGKNLMGITIVDSFKHTIPERNNLLKRYAFYFFIGYVPLVGGIISLVNVLFIFGKEKRCIHDNVASTMVVSDNK